MITAMDGSARLAALGTPTDISVQMNLDRQMVGALLDASTDAAMGNGMSMPPTMGSSASAVTDPSQSAAIHAK